MLAKRMTREFIYDQGTGKDKIKLADPDVNLPPDRVRMHYAAQYPLLTSSKIEGPKMENRKMVYTFKIAVGTKG